MQFKLLKAKDTGFNSGRPVWTLTQVKLMLKRAYEQGRKDAAKEIKSV